MLRWALCAWRAGGQTKFTRWQHCTRCRCCDSEIFAIMCSVSPSREDDRGRVSPVSTYHIRWLPNFFFFENCYLIWINVCSPLFCSVFFLKIFFRNAIRRRPSRRWIFRPFTTKDYNCNNKCKNHRRNLWPVRNTSTRRRRRSRLGNDAFFFFFVR